MACNKESGGYTALSTQVSLHLQPSHTTPIKCVFWSVINHLIMLWAAFIGVADALRPLYICAPRTYRYGKNFYLIKVHQRRELGTRERGGIFFHTNACAADEWKNAGALISQPPARSAAMLPQRINKNSGQTAFDKRPKNTAAHAGKSAGECNFCFWHFTHCTQWRGQLMFFCTGWALKLYSC
jgi:hypothetical protein